MQKSWENLSLSSLDMSTVSRERCSGLETPRKALKNWTNVWSIPMARPLEASTRVSSATTTSTRCGRPDGMNLPSGRHMLTLLCWSGWRYLRGIFSRRSFRVPSALTSRGMLPCRLRPVTTLERSTWTRRKDPEERAGLVRRNDRIALSSLVRAFRRSQSSCIDARRPLIRGSTATNRGVPLSPVAFTSAPCATSSFTTASWPLRAAMCSGVSPSLFAASTSAFSLMSSSQRDADPMAAAW
mmetsp:Transcript_23618/g.59137  ORF Transcript_23618/g.59137 Transcript_23618/m.59137 type:complete len:241 (-) Transcript_23618:1314-2036(-)